MGVFLIILGFFLFFYVTHKFEHNETVKAAKRQIAKEIREGISIELVDGRIVYKKDISIQNKRLTPHYSYLIKRGRYAQTLDNFDLERLNQEYIAEKSKEREIRLENARLQMIKEVEDRYKKKEKEEKERALRKKISRQKKWAEAKKVCMDFESTISPDTAGVYLIHSKSTDDFYIGSSSNLKKRKYQHLNSLKNQKHYSYKIQEHYEKYGGQNFDFYSLEKIIDDEDYLRGKLEEREQYFIDLLKPTYNYYKDVKKGKRHGLRKDKFNHF